MHKELRSCVSDDVSYKYAVCIANDFTKHPTVLQQPTSLTSIRYSAPAILTTFKSLTQSRYRPTAMLLLVQRIPVRNLSSRR